MITKPYKFAENFGKILKIRSLSESTCYKQTREENRIIFRSILMRH